MRAYNVKKGTRISITTAILVDLAGTGYQVHDEIFNMIYKVLGIRQNVCVCFIWQQ